MGWYPQVSRSDQGATRRSLGGQVVEAGLTSVGFHWCDHAELSLIETARPHWHPYRVVMAQNAWNVVRTREFISLLRRHPVRSWPRFALRRMIAHINLRRADQVVCLTHAMGVMCARFSTEITILPVTVPVDFLALAERPRRDDKWADVVLVPGTVTWHKDSPRAIEIFSHLKTQRSNIGRVVFAGGDDGSGCWQAVERAAVETGVSCTRAVLSREEMISACASSAMVLIPSVLESLSLSFAESLALADVVVASDLPAHREVADRIGRQPVWLFSDGRLDSAGATPRVDLDVGRFSGEWAQLGESLARTLELKRAS